jgi:uncharacterized protein (TIGR02271 family)
MATQAHSTVIGVFQDSDKAREAVRELKAAGFSDDQIGVASSNREGLHRASDNKGDESYAGEGAAAGVATGAGIGALWGLGIFAGLLPAIGPAIAGGTLAGILLSSAVAGAAAAGLTGALIGMGISKEEAEFYEGEVKSGRTIVTVNAGTRRNEALAILQRLGGYDMSSRVTAASSAAPLASHTSTTSSSAASARSHEIAGTGKSCEVGHTATSMPVTTSTASHAANSSAASAGGTTVRAHEEQAQVHKTPVKTGEVEVRKEVHTEHKTIDVPVTREEVVIERHPVSGQTASAADIQAEKQEIRIPVKEEQVSIEKQAVVKEEVTVGKRQVHDTQRVATDLRKEEIKVEKHGDADVCDKDRK